MPKKISDFPRCIINERKGSCSDAPSGNKMFFVKIKSAISVHQNPTMSKISVIVGSTLSIFKKFTKG